STAPATGSWPSPTTRDAVVPSRTRSRGGAGGPAPRLRRPPPTLSPPLAPGASAHPPPPPRPAPPRRRPRPACAAGLAAGAALPGTARARGAAAVEPDIDSTAAWNARAPKGTISVLQYRPSRIVVHHTASTNSTDHSRGQAHAHAHWVQDL